MNRSWKVMPVVAVALTAAACGRTPAPAPAPAADQPPPSTPAVAPATRPTDDGRAAAEAAARDRVRVLIEPVYFDYDRAEIRRDARTALEAKVPALREAPGISLVIEGHADERGSTEYNQVLGMRRATGVKEFLTSYGIDAGRLQTVSFGEERPAASGSNESAWARNRRAEFEIQGGPVREAGGRR